MKLTGTAAIEYAEAHDLTLSKYNDPIEDAREGLTPTEARKVASEDPSLIYLEVEAPNAETLHLYNENCALAGQICQDDSLIERESDDIHAVTGTQAELIEHARQLVESSGAFDRKCGRSILEWFGTTDSEDVAELGS